MNRPTVRDFRSRYAAYAQAVGSPLGRCIGDIPALCGMLNASTERLLFDPLQPEEGWWGTWLKMVFNVSCGQPFITLPRGFSRVILMDVCRRPTPVQNGFYEFLEFGRGLQEPGPYRGQFAWDRRLQAYDRDTVNTLAPLLGTPQFIQVFPTDPRDQGKTVIVQGSDQNGMNIMSTDPVTNQTISGEIVTLNFPFSVTKNQFLGGIDGIEKDPTYGPVTFFQQDAASGKVNPLSQMEPSETSAAYRTYLVQGLDHGQCCQSPPTQRQVTAMCKVEFTPVSSDSDYLVIPCVPALLSECEAIRFESMDNAKVVALAAPKHQKALQLLFGQLDHYLGNQKPAIRISLFGSDPLPVQRI